MPKIITNKEIIYDALINIKSYNLSYTQICKIIKIDRKTAYNYLKKGIQNIIKPIYRKKFIDLIPDNVINFIIHKTINNPIFNAQKLIHNIFKTYNISIKKYHLYEI